MATPTSKQRHAGTYDAFGYNEARSKLHEQILDHLFADVPTQVAQPFFMPMWGGANSAKSVVLNILLKRGCLGETPAVFDMDVFEHIPEYAALKSMAPHPEKEPFLKDEYYDLMHKALIRARERGSNLVIDDHGDHVDMYRRHLDYLADFEKKHPDAPHMQTILLGQAIEPNYFMWRLENRAHIGLGNLSKADNHAFTQKAVQQFQALAETWEQLAPHYDLAILNETALGLNQRIERIATYDKQDNGTTRITFDARRFAETVTAWKFVNPLAYSSDTLWPQTSLDDASDIRRGMAYGGNTKPPTYDTAPKTLIHSPETAIGPRIIEELDHRRPGP